MPLLEGVNVPLKDRAMLGDFMPNTYCYQSQSQKSDSSISLHESSSLDLVPTPGPSNLPILDQSSLLSESQNTSDSDANSDVALENVVKLSANKKPHFSLKLKDNDIDKLVNLDYGNGSALSPASSDCSDRASLLEVPTDSDVYDDDDALFFPGSSSDQKIKRPIRPRPSACVFVASLAATESDDNLCITVKKHFEQYGNLIIVKVLRDQENRPYAFVQYEDDISAKIALREAQHAVLNGRTIRCEPARVNRTLFISNRYAVTEKKICDMLSEFGEIEELVRENTRLPKAMPTRNWFVKFVYRDDAIRAYANSRLKDNCTVEWAQNIDTTSHNIPKDLGIDKYSIFVGQLDPKVTKEILIEHFSSHGKVVEASLIVRLPNRDASRKTFNFAFIKYESEEAAAAAVEQENHAMLMDKTMHVQYRELHRVAPKPSSDKPRLALAPPPVNLSVRMPTGARSVSDHSAFNRFPKPTLDNSQRTPKFSKRRNSIGKFPPSRHSANIPYSYGFYPQQYQNAYPVMNYQPSGDFRGYKPDRPYDAYYYPPMMYGANSNPQKYIMPMGSSQGMSQYDMHPPITPFKFGSMSDANATHNRGPDSVTPSPDSHTASSHTTNYYSPTSTSSKGESYPRSQMNMQFPVEYPNGAANFDHKNFKNTGAPHPHPQHPQSQLYYPSGPVPSNPNYYYPRYLGMDHYYMYYGGNNNSAVNAPNNNNINEENKNAEEKKAGGVFNKIDAASTPYKSQVVNNY